MSMTLDEIIAAVDAGKTVCWREDAFTLSLEDDGTIVINDCRGVRYTSIPKDTSQKWHSKDFYILDEPASEAGDIAVDERPNELAVVGRGGILVITFESEKEAPECRAFAELWDGVENRLLAEHWVALHNAFLGVPDPVAAVRDLRQAADFLVSETEALLAISTPKDVDNDVYCAMDDCRRALAALAKAQQIHDESEGDSDE